MQTLIEGQAQAVPDQPLIPRTLEALVASDGKPQSDGALLAARLLQPRGRITIVAALPPIPVVSPEVQVPIDPQLESARGEELVAAVREQADRVIGDESRWSIDLRLGVPTVAIVDAARETGADVLCTGLGEHGFVARVFGDETALRLIRLGSLPVLAVPPTFTRAPRTIVVAMDFSSSSMRAADLALELASESATVFLVHVVPRPDEISAWQNGDWLVSYERKAEAELRDVLLTLDVPAGVSVEPVVLHGDPASQLIGWAKKHGADLIAAGSHGHGFVSRMLVGSVVSKVVRAAPCGVLVMPHLAPQPTTRASTRSAPATADVVRRPEWTARLDDFTRKNIGRRAILEVDDPELGAQSQELDYPLLGASYDPHDRRVQLMLGDLGYVDRHLTRSIGDVRAVDVLKSSDGRDLALRIAHGAGQSVLTFTK